MPDETSTDPKPKDVLSVFSKDGGKRDFTVSWWRSDDAVLVHCKGCASDHAELNTITGRLYCPGCKSLEFLANY